MLLFIVSIGDDLCDEIHLLYSVLSGNEVYNCICYLTVNTSACTFAVESVETVCRHY